MKSVISTCMKLTSEEIAHASRGGEAFFVPTSDGRARLVGRKEALPDSAIPVDAESAIRRSGIFSKDFPDLLPNDLVETIVMGMPDKEYDIRRTDVRASVSKVSDLLRAAKLSFQESDTVGEVSELFAGDRMFVRFEEDGELYSITVKDSSVTVPKPIVSGSNSAPKNLRAAMCEVAYRAKDADGHFIERNLLGIMRLPIAPGSKMIFSDKGRVISELSAHPVRKIQLKRA